MRFTIRDILLLTVIVAVVTAWGLDRWRLWKQVEQLQSRVRLHQAEERRSRLLLELEQQNLKLFQERYGRVFAEKQQVERLLQEIERERELNELVKRGYLDLPRRIPR